MRIGVVAPGYPPDLGGIERHVTGVSRGLRDLGHTVEVWTQRAQAPMPTAELVEGICVRRFPSTRSARFPISPSLWRHARRHAEDVDVLHVHSYHSTVSLAALLARPTPFVFVPHFHGTGHTPLARMLHTPWEPVGRRLISTSAHIIANSAAEQRLLHARFALTETHCTVIHEGVDDRELLGAQAWPEQPPTLVVLGRLERYKRVDLVLRAFSAIGAPGKLVVIGDGPERERLQALARQLPRAKDVSFTGPLSDADVGRWLATARSVVSMSEHEAFGLVALESLATGGSALLSDIPAHRELQALAGPRITIVDAGDLALVARRVDESLHAPRETPLVVRSWNDVARDHAAVLERALRST